jgi:hypothetical protein
MNFRRLFASATSLCVIAVAALTSELALGQHFDILLARPASGTQTVIGGADVDANSFDDVTRVFEGEMGVIGTEFVALEPGVDHPNLNIPPTNYPASAAGLMPGDVLRLIERNFTVNGLTDDLFYWNGTGPVAFAPSLADFRIDGGNPLSGTAGVGGSFHDHPFLVVDSTALPGLYLASVYGVVDGFAPSEPAYLVFATGEEFEDAHGVAAEWVETNLVPEPASLGLAAIAFGAIFGVRRRKWLL